MIYSAFVEDVGSHNVIILVQKVLLFLLNWVITVHRYLGYYVFEVSLKSLSGFCLFSLQLFSVAIFMFNRVCSRCLSFYGGSHWWAPNVSFISSFRGNAIVLFLSCILLCLRARSLYSPAFELNIIWGEITPLVIICVVFFLWKMSSIN